MQVKRITIGMLAVTGIALSGCSAEADGHASGGESRVLTYATSLEEESPYTIAFTNWAQEIEERTEGRITFEAHYNGSLCEPYEVSSCVAAGTADMGLTVPAYEPSLYPLSQVTTIGFVTNDLQTISGAFNDLYSESDELQQEWQDVGVYPLLNFPAASNVFASGHELNSFDDFEGMSVRATGDAAVALSSLGVNSVTMTLPESYEGIERGVISGMNTALDVLVNTRIYEVAPYVYDVGEYWGNGHLIHTIISDSVWESLAPEDQQIMQEVADDLGGSFVEDIMIPDAEEDCSFLAENNVTVTDIGPKEVGEDWAREAQSMQLQEWQERASLEPEVAQPLFDRFTELVHERENPERNHLYPAAVCMESQ